MTTYSEAVDLMLSRVQDAANAKAQDILGYEPELEVEGVRDTTPNERQKKVWYRAVVRNALEEQSTLGTDDSLANTVEYESTGILIIQVYMPRSKNTDLPKGRLLAEEIRNAFRRASTDIWYKNATLKENRPEKRWNSITVTVEYNFTELVSN